MIVKFPRRSVWSSTSHTHFGRCWVQTWFLILPPAHISSRCGNCSVLWCVEGWQENVKSCYCVSPLIVSACLCNPRCGDGDVTRPYNTHTRQSIVPTFSQQRQTLIYKRGPKNRCFNWHDWKTNHANFTGHGRLFSLFTFSCILCTLLVEPLIETRIDGGCCRWPPTLGTFVV